MTNLSQWFDLAEQKPWQVGVYELTGNASWHCYAYWDGQSFSYAWTSEIVGSRQLAYEYRNQKNQVHWFSRMKKWRGLSTNPEVKKKPSRNRKATKHIVFLANYTKTYKRVVGSYDCIKAARIHADRVPYGYVETIRFRTPE